MAAAATVAAIVWVIVRVTISESVTNTNKQPLAESHAVAVQVDGDIRGDGSESIGAAVVCAYNATTARLDRYCATADAQGAYSLALAPGRYSVTASANNYASVTSQLNIEDSQSVRLNFTLSRQAPTLAGIVKSATGERLAAARVAIYKSSELISNTTTNEQGEFAAWTPAGAMLINVTADGFGAAMVQTVAPTMDVAITLYPGIVVTGQVLLEDSLRPVPNVHVTAVNRPDRVVSQLRDVVAQTDEHGRFAFDNLAAGAWALTVADRQVWGSVPTPLVVNPGKSQHDITLLVKPAAAVAGRLVMSDSETPCRAGRVHLTPEAMARQGELSPGAKPVVIADPVPNKAMATPPFSALADEDGAVRFDAVPLGAYRVGSICDEHQWAGGPTSLEITGAGASDLMWKFTPGLGVPVRVVDEAGRPVIGAAVALSLQATGTSSQDEMILAQRKGKTDAMGQYRFGGLRVGRYEVSARYGAINGEAVATDAINLQSNIETPIELTLPGQGSVRIHARTTSGQSISRILFFATDAAGSRYEGSYKGEGNYVIGPLPHGRYRVFGYDNKNAKQSLNGGNPVQIADSSPIDLDFSYEMPTARLQGRVSDANGAPLSGVFIRAVSTTLDEDDERYSVIQAAVHGGQEQMTDRNGAFLIEGLKNQATYDIYIDHPDGLQDIRRSVSPGDFVEVIFPAPTTVMGSVISRDGKPVVRFDAVIIDSEGRNQSQSVNDPNGRFRIERVRPGISTIAIYENAEQERQTERVVTIAAGQTVDLGVFTLENSK